MVLRACPFAAAVFFEGLVDTEDYRHRGLVEGGETCGRRRSWRHRVECCVKGIAGLSMEETIPAVSLFVSGCLKTIIAARQVRSKAASQTKQIIPNKQIVQKVSIKAMMYHVGKHLTGISR